MTTTTTTSEPNAPQTDDPNVNKAGRERALQDDAALRKSGLAFEEQTVYPFGYRLVAAGQETYQQLRLEHEQRPMPYEATAYIQDLYAKEERQDITVELPQLRMACDGRVGRGQGQLPIGRYALGQLMARGGAPRGAGSYLAGCPSPMRAEHVNYWLERAFSMEAPARRANNGQPARVRVNQTATLRTRREVASKGGPRGIFAVVGKGYTRGGAFDFPQAVEAFFRAVPSDARCEFTYDGRRWRMRSSFFSPVLPADAVVGDAFRVSLWIESCDDGSAGILIGLDAERIRCLNCTTIYTKKLEGSIRHGLKAMADRITSVTQKALAKIAPFADAWRQATVEQIAEDVYSEGVEHVFRQMVEARVVHVAGIKDDDMVSRLVNAWNAEPEYTKAGILNAVTRAAHQETWRSCWDGAELEQQAGDLLFNWNVLSLVPPSSDGQVASSHDLLEVN